jgi:hypothetical protein
MPNPILAEAVPIAVLGNVSEECERVTTGPVPVPLNDTFCGEPPALSAMFTVAVTVPAARGLNVR